MQKTPIILSVLSAISLVAATCLPQKLAINPTTSAPKGLYWIANSRTIKTGDLVIVSVPVAHKDFVVARGYLGKNIPLIKQIVAMKGDRVCAKNRRIYLNNRPVAVALETDSSGRPMPAWSGCSTLKDGQFFALMNTPDSLDGRYFGPMKLDQVIGIAKPLWTEKVD